MSADLAARRAAAQAVLTDYLRGVNAADVADRALWAARLADMLIYLLDGLTAEQGAPVQPPAAAEQLEEIRLVLESSGWQASPPDVFAFLAAAKDWQIALEEISDIVNRDKP